MIGLLRGTISGRGRWVTFFLVPLVCPFCGRAGFYVSGVFDCFYTGGSVGLLDVGGRLAWEWSTCRGMALIS